jgi:general stress protein 26
MDPSELMNKIEAILDDAKAAVLGTTDDQGRPHLRWMTASILKGRPGSIFAVASPGAAKIQQVQGRHDVEWMIQTRALDEVVNVRGVLNVVENPALKKEIMEALGPRLMVFWTANVGAENLVVLETVMREASYLCPMKGRREIVKFG